MKGYRIHYSPRQWAWQLPFIHTLFSPQVVGSLIFMSYFSCPNTGLCNVYVYELLGKPVCNRYIYELLGEPESNSFDNELLGQANVTELLGDPVCVLG